LAIGFATLYFALVSRQSYAWLFTGLTFSMILIDSIQHRGGEVAYFAWSRFIEVLVGTGVCVVVSAISTHTVHRQLMPRSAVAAPERTQTSIDRHGPAIQHSLQGAIALALISVDVALV
jgi:uncharacterized membrane protein YccC